MAPRLSSTRRAALLEGASSCWIVSPHHPQQPGARSSSLAISDRALRSHSTPCETAPTRSSSDLAAHATSGSSTYSIQHSATTKKNTHPTRLHHVTNIQLLAKIQIWLKPIFDAPNLPWWRQDFHQPVAQLCYRDPVLAGSCLHTTHSSQGAKIIFWDFRKSTTEPFHTMWNSSYAKFFQFGSPCNFSIIHLQHPTQCHHQKKNTHPTRLHHVTNIQLLSKIQIWLNPILTYPTSLHGAKTFINASRSYATVSQLSGRVSTPPAAAHLWIVPTEHYGAIPHHVKQLLREVLPIWQPIQLPTGQQHATHRNHKTALIRQHWTM